MALAATFPIHSSLAVSEGCPKTDQGETAEDCPWAEITRALENAITRGEDLEKTFEKIFPHFLEKIETEGKLHSGPEEYKALWGKSLNFDEGAKSIIIENPIIDMILSRASVRPRDGRIVHAGFEHTYGYLFSNLSTPYGYKRARWVRNDIELGFGFPAGLMGPLPPTGGLFSNVTYFAGSIAFRNDPEVLKIIKKGLGVSPFLRTMDLSTLKPTRLQETITLAGGRTITLRSDFVPFTGPTGANAEVLIYSIKDSNLPFPQLISMFPVAKNYRDGALNPKNLGVDKTISTRYNAYVVGVTGTNKPFKGERKIEKELENK